MIQNPKSLTEQLLNLAERIAIELRTVVKTVGTKISKKDADTAYLGKTAKAASAKIADSATKATQDSNGNVIVNTYATKTELTNGLANKLATTAKIPYSQITGTPSIPDTSGLIPKIGARGQLNGYETQTPSSGAATTIGYLTGDCVVHNAINQTALTVTVDGGGISDIGSSCGVKVLFIYNTASLTSLSVKGANGITNIDWEGENSPSLNGKQIIQIVFFLHDISASINLKQWS